MTADVQDEALHFDTGADQEQPAESFRKPFTIDSDPTILWATRPKQAILLKLARGLVGDNESAQVEVFDLFLDEVLDPESAEYLRGRLEDKDDKLDIPHLMVPLQALVGLWYGRPTKSQAASRPSPRRTGKGSTVRARSRG